MSLTLEMSGQEQTEPVQKRPSQDKMQAGSITCPPVAGQAPKEDWKCNLMCQQKDTSHLGRSVRRGATLGCGSLGDDPPPHIPLEFPSSPPGRALPIHGAASPGSWLRTQGWEES